MRGVLRVLREEAGDMKDEEYAERIRLIRDCIHRLYTSYIVYCEFDEDCGKLMRYLPDDLEAASVR